MNTTKDLCTPVIDLFRHPPKGPHYHPTINSNSDISDNSDDNVLVVNDDDSNSNNCTFITPTSMVNIFRSHMIDIQVNKGRGK